MDAVWSRVHCPLFQGARNLLGVCAEPWGLRHGGLRGLTPLPCICLCNATSCGQNDATDCVSVHTVPLEWVRVMAKCSSECILNGASLCHRAGICCAPGRISLMFNMCFFCLSLTFSQRLFDFDHFRHGPLLVANISRLLPH